MYRFRNPNLLKDPADPEYDHSFDEEKEFAAYEEAMEAKAEFERENQE